MWDEICCLKQKVGAKRTNLGVHGTLAPWERATRTPRENRYNIARLKSKSRIPAKLADLGAEVYVASRPSTFRKSTISKNPEGGLYWQFSERTRLVWGRTEHPIDIWVPLRPS